MDAPRSWRPPSSFWPATPPASSPEPRWPSMAGSIAACFSSVGGLGPPSGKWLDRGGGLPVLANRREDVHHGYAADTGLRGVGKLAGDRVRLPYPQLARLPIDHHGHRTAQDEPDLLVLMPVLGNLSIRVDVDEPDGDPVPVHDAGEHPVPDARGLQSCDGLKDIHGHPPICCALPFSCQRP